MNNIKLSICIPTYNRDWCLEELLPVLAQEITETIKNYIEVIFSDNNSNDKTQELLTKFCSQYSWAKYYRNNTNIGFGLNYHKVLSYAKGAFCWVLGDDDIPKKNCLEKLINEINRNPDIDIFLFDFTNTNKKLEPIKNYTALKTNKIYYNLTKREELCEYFDNSTYSSTLFSYISCYIFKHS